MTRLLVTGSRHWTDRQMLFDVLDQWHATVGISVLIEGCAHGADELAGHHPPDPDHRQHTRPGHDFDGGWAWHRGVGFQHFKAEWEKFGDRRKGNPAGAIRNSRMLVDGEPEMVIAFHDPHPGNCGTEDMRKKAEKWGLEVIVVSHPEGLAPQGQSVP